MPIETPMERFLRHIANGVARRNFTDQSLESLTPREHEIYMKGYRHCGDFVQKLLNDWKNEFDNDIKLRQKEFDNDIKLRQKELDEMFGNTIRGKDLFT